MPSCFGLVSTCLDQAQQRLALHGRRHLCPRCLQQRGHHIYQLDARYTRTFLTIKERLRPKFIAEFNNVFNRENITSLNTTATVDANGVITTPPSLSPLSTVLEKRIVQFGVRLDW